MTGYDYSRVFGACCENVVGYIPIPLGIAGPLKIDGVNVHIPMATAEGTLVASASRGCKALNAGGGVTTVVHKDGMTRGPAIDFPSVVQAAQEKLERNHDVMSTERVRLRDHRSKSWGTTWLVILSMVVAVVGFIMTFFIIKFT